MTLISRLVFFNQKKTLNKSSGRIITNEVSIVIPVKDNQQGIDSYLDAFFNTHNKFYFPKEIIIVDNNSRRPIVINNRFMSLSLPLILLKCTIPGPGAARNLGFQNATGKWILFNDSDCLPTKSLISGYQRSDNNSIAYAGNVKATEDDKLSKYYDSQEILIPLKTLFQDGSFVPQYLITANTLIWKEALIEIGGFNECITLAGGEDVDLGLRLAQIGNLSYAMESIVLHSFNDGWIGFYKRFVRYGKGNRLVAVLWGADLKPTLFRPNKKTFFNELAAKLQFVFLSIGYHKPFGLTKPESSSM